MHAFAGLLDSLTYTRSRHVKLTLIADYLPATPAPDPGRDMAAWGGGPPVAGGGAQSPRRASLS